MAATLAGDPGLSALFEFNRKVRTLHGRHYIVDLLWEAGKVVVEIDGYTFHGTRSAFASDRNRDYELMISSYIVLRIPHWEVMDDLDHALEKIRDIVAFRRKEGLYGF
jgi:very-short-patch-repair endonuclease